MHTSRWLIASAALLTLTACKGLSLEDTLSLGMQSAQIMSLSDNDIKQLTQKSCQEMDSKNKVAPANSAYTQRLNRIANTLGHNVNGTPVNYKVYLTNDVNAWAMANGCVRVYSGLMDKMTDNEIQGVLGHELGHVALGHSKKSVQVAYATELARNTIVKTANSSIADLTSSQLGDLAQKLVNSQFSQSQELAADNFSYDYLKKRNLNPAGIASAFDKLGGGSSLLSTHPASSKRSNNIRQRMLADQK